MGFRYYRSCGTCGTEIGADSGELADAQLAKHPCLPEQATFIEEVAQAVKGLSDVEHVGLAFPIDGPEQQSIIVNLADGSLWVIDVSKVNPL